MTHPDVQPAPPAEPPVVFFSYAWTSEAHKERVLGLRNRLRSDGVDALIDQVNLRDGEDTFHFMERIATDPKLKKVVAVCDRNYAEKVDARKGGSGTEGSIMSPEVYGQIGDGPNKYVAVVFEKRDDGQAYVPTMFATRLYIDMSTDDLLAQNYLRLLRFLFDRPEPEVPIGTPPAVLFETDPTSVAALSKGMLLRSTVERGRRVTTPWKEFMTAVLGPLRAFTAPWKDQHWDIGDALKQLGTTVGARDALVDTVRFLVREDALKSGMLVELFQALGNLTYEQAELWGVQTEATAHTRLAVTELVLYVVAVLIQEGRPDLLREVLTSDYLWVYQGEERLTEFGFLQQDVSWFDETYNAASKTQWTSPRAEYMKRRATVESLPWKEILQADALLHLQTHLRERTGSMQNGAWYGVQTWYGQLGPYWGREGKFTLFLRCASQAFLQDWLPVFGLPSAEAIRAVVNNRSGDPRAVFPFPRDANFSAAMALAELGTRP